MFVLVLVEVSLNYISHKLSSLGSVKQKPLFNFSDFGTSLLLYNMTNLHKQIL